eukprot:CAMPEP_0184676708 /NCGR_PEP_ID=MMETSP0308-20130426/88495_1 /TAXON_ID=38269 /ORGANISM="Gloeochaete witrockiana, Strain SAG 46.84" /LENGTH=139 /DNA_ID=CAMNT_0027124557 /DNA_START=69 /DNA_END=488 /DNA_ORIENTATION=-
MGSSCSNSASASDVLSVDSRDENLGHRIQSSSFCEFCSVQREGFLGRDRFHCLQCRACFSMTTLTSHSCSSGCLDSVCSFCHTNMFGGINSKHDGDDPCPQHEFVIMACGHLIHSSCLTLLLKDSAVCPICWSSVYPWE